MELGVLLLLAIAGVAGTVEVHFENKDGGFFLKHTPRQYYQAVADLAGGGSPGGVGAMGDREHGGHGGGGGSAVLSVDRFTVFQTSQPISIRATYGPFSTKQTVPARYIVPDPLDALPLPDPAARPPANASSAAAAAAAAALLDLDLSATVSHHLDMSAHVVRGAVARDSPVLRVLFHAGADPGARRRLLLGRHRRVCIVLHASLGPDRTPLTAVCSPDGEDGVCLAQVTVPASWWAPLPPPDASGRPGKPVKTPQRLVQVAYSVLEPGSEADGSSGSSSNAGANGGCQPRVQIQPVTPLGAVPLAPARAAYRELRLDEALSMLLPHAPLYPLSRLHVPVFLQQSSAPAPGAPRREYSVSMFVIRARVKSGLRLLGAEASSEQWNVSADINPKQTVATVTAFRREPPPDQQQQTSKTQSWGAEEVFTWLLEVTEDAADLYDGGRVVWSVRYVLDGADAQPPPPAHAHSHAHAHGSHRAGGGSGGTHGRVGTGGGGQRDAANVGGGGGGAGGEETKRKVTARLDVQKDDIQAVLPISKNWEVINTAVLTGRQVSQAMKVFIVSQAGKVADVTLQSSCHSEDESVLKVSSSCSSVYVDGSEQRGSSNASVLVKYGTYTGLARFTVWMPEFPLEVHVADFRLSQVKGWKVPDPQGQGSGAKMKRATEDYRAAGGVGGGGYRGWGDPGVDAAVNGVDTDRSHTTCRLRFQQSPVEVYARFLAADQDTGRVSYFVSRRTWLRVTDLVESLLRVSDPRIASLAGRILQGRGTGRTEVQVLSPITGRVIGAKEVRVGSDKVTVTKLVVRVVSGLQLSIAPDSTVENGYVAETSVTRKLTAQYQEGLLDIDLEFSDDSRTPLRQVASSDYQLLVDSLDPEVVAFAPMVASAHPRVIAVGEGRGDLLRVTLLLAEDCRAPPRPGSRPPKGSSMSALGKGVGASPLAAASAYVEVDFSASDLPQRPDFVQNDGGGAGGGAGASGGLLGTAHGGRDRDRKAHRDMAPDLHDILIGIPLKDENNHEPTVQARQHRSGQAVQGLGAGVGGRHRGSNVHMTPLEIGMYVLLAAFCFAIVVFVVSCVVYASKFKPQTALESPVLGSAAGSTSSTGTLGGAGPRTSSAAGPAPAGSSPGGPAGGGGAGGSGPRGGGGGGGGKAARESTTNAHDWVWLGRATLERASGHGHSHGGHGQCSASHLHNNNNNNNNNNGKEIRITANPMIGYGDMPSSMLPEDEAAALGNCFDNPTHIELPSAMPISLRTQHQHAAAAALAPSAPMAPPIDTATYCKKDKVQRTHGVQAPPVPKHKGSRSTAPDPDDVNDSLWQITPPPLPPHGLPPPPDEAELAAAAADPSSEYKPPVPPHRNIGVTARIGPARTQPGPVPGFLTQQQQQLQQQILAAAAAAAAANAAAAAAAATASGNQSPAPPRRHHHHHHHHRTASGASGGGHRRHAPKPPDLVADGVLQPPQGSSSGGGGGGGDLPPPVPRHHKPRAVAAAKDASMQSPLGVAAVGGVYADAALSAAQLSPDFVEYPAAGVVGMLGANQHRGHSPEVKRATIVGNPMFSAMEGAVDLADDFRPKEDLIGLDDFNLTMDYEQLVEYFDNLKESNA